MLRGFLPQSPLHLDEYDEALLEQARSSRDRDERLHAYRDFERGWLGEQVALVPFAYSRQCVLRRPWVEGVWANALTQSTLAEAVVRR
jgi:ABC-type oligopeptide transport system substrate-binding subunit